MGYERHNTPLFLYLYNPQIGYTILRNPRSISSSDVEMEEIDPLFPNSGDQSTAFRASSRLVQMIPDDEVALPFDQQFIA